MSITDLCALTAFAWVQSPLGDEIIRNPMCRRPSEYATPYWAGRYHWLAGEQSCIAPAPLAVGFTRGGGATHAAWPGAHGFACGRPVDQAWDRDIDRSNLPITCKTCQRSVAFHRDGQR